MIGWLLLAGVVLGILLRSADLEAKRRRRQEANRKSRHQVSSMPANLAPPLDIPPAHPNCRCTLAPIPEAALDEMLHGVNRRIRRDLRELLEPSEAEVNRVLAELERLSSSTE